VYDTEQGEKAMQTKVVYKFPTGGEIPEGATYLCTQVETVTRTRREKGIKDQSVSNTESRKSNVLVWHYYELPNELAATWHHTKAGA
jgi:hypothetical protein